MVSLCNSLVSPGDKGLAYNRIDNSNYILSGQFLNLFLDGLSLNTSIKLLGILNQVLHSQTFKLGYMEVLGVFGIDDSLPAMIEVA